MILVVVKRPIDIEENDLEGGIHERDYTLENNHRAIFFDFNLITGFDALKKIVAQLIDGNQLHALPNIRENDACCAEGIHVFAKEKRRWSDVTFLHCLDDHASGCRTDGFG